MRLAHVPVPLQGPGSSITTVIRHLCREGVARGDEQFAIMADDTGVDIEDAVQVRVPYREHVPAGGFTARQMRREHALAWVARARPHSPRVFTPAVEAARTLRPDAVLLHEGYYATGSLPLWDELYPEGRVVLYVHTRVSRVYRPRELRRLLQSAHGLVFVSRFMLEATEKRVGRLPRPAAVVHNGVDRRVFHPIGRPARTDALRVTFAGQVAEHKGPHLLIQAVARSRTPVRLRIVGSSAHAVGAARTAYEEGLREMASAAKVDVEFIPYQAAAALADHLRDSDVVCVPSLVDEAFGMVALEAMACGAAVVASGRGGLAEACGGAAVLVDPEDLDALARTLDDLGSSSTLELAQGASLARAETASWTSAYETLRDQLEVWA